MSMPLGNDPVSRLQSGLQHDRNAAQYTVERKRFEHSQEWQDLNIRFKDAQERLRLAGKYEGVQKQKLDHERNRHRLGRSTTAQVIMFEQDFASAQLVRLRTEGEVWRILAQMKAQVGRAEQ